MASVKIEKPADWFDKILPEKMTQHPEKSGGFSGTFSFKINGDKGGEWAVTIQDAKLAVNPGMDPESKFTITMKDEDFVKLMNGELNGQVAFMTGKLKFKGSMSTAMKLQGLLF
jgi:putative sterol carrier protein